MSKHRLPRTIDPQFFTSESPNLLALEEQGKIRGAARRTRNRVTWDALTAIGQRLFELRLPPALRLLNLVSTACQQREDFRLNYVGREF